MTASQILIVEDDEDLCEILRRALEEQGYKILTYQRADYALNDLRNGYLNPQLMIVDYRMPNMSGAQFLKLKSLIPQKNISECPSLILSAEKDSTQMGLENIGNIRGFIRKPPELSHLLNTIKECLEVKTQ